MGLSYKIPGTYGDNPQSKGRRSLREHLLREELAGLRHKRQWGPPMLKNFPRYPLTFGPTPYREAGAAFRPSRRPGRALRQARGLQLGPRLRRQQAAQARVHHPRRARLQCRSAGLHRRRAVEPHPHGGGGRGQDRHEVPAGAGELGAARGCRLRPRRQHHAVAASWAPTCAWSMTASTSASARAGRRRSRT